MPPFDKIKCPKCKSTNFVNSKFCVLCHTNLRQAHLKASPNYALFTFFGVAVTEKLLRIVLIGMGIFLVNIVVYHYYLAIPVPPTQYDQSAIIAEIERQNNIELPDNIWFNSSLWRFYFKRPSANQIISKHNEMTAGGWLRPKIVKTVTMNGTVGVLKISNVSCNSKYENCASQNSNSTELNHFDPFTSNFTQNGKIELSFEKTNRSYSQIQLPNESENAVTKFLRGFDGSSGWSQTTITKAGDIIVNRIEDLEKEKLDALKADMEVAMVSFQSVNNNIEYGATKKIYDKSCYVLIEKHDGRIKHLNFDAVTGYLFSIQYFGGYNVYFDDYREVDGIKMPYKIYYFETDRLGNSVWMKVEVIEWLINYSVDQTLFNKPTSFEINSLTYQ